jgi:hypothetical protein
MTQPPAIDNACFQAGGRLLFQANSAFLKETDAGMEPKRSFFTKAQPAKSFALCAAFLLFLVQNGWAQDQPRIYQQPANQIGVIGGVANFSVSVSGVAPFAYQWSFDGAALPGGTSSVLTLDPVNITNAGSYEVMVTNFYGSTTSSVATLTVQPVRPALYWMPTTAPQLEWTCVASSADGTTFAAGANSGLYMSTNSGETWASNNLPSQGCTSIGVSPDGTVLAALDGDAYCYISTNSGANWQLSPNVRGSFITFSTDGTCLAVMGQYVFVSTNLGATWTVNSKATAALGSGGIPLALSADGTEMLIVAVEGEELDYSTNSGVSWFVSFDHPDETFFTVTSSADGSKLTAAYFSEGIFVSTNAGTNWNLAGSPLNTGFWINTASVTGSRLIAAQYCHASPGGIYTSTDFGATWTSNQAPPQCWQQVACSQDGTRLVAIGDETIYTAQWPPDLAIQPSGGSIVLSWPAPSTGFVLQECVDLTMTNWAAVPIAPVTSNYQNQVILPLSTNTMIFRLAGPSF